MTDLSVPGVPNLIAERIKREIDAYCIKAYDDGHRLHLGASLIGSDCARYLWYSFRWCISDTYLVANEETGKLEYSPSEHGRVMRRHQRGHLEELRIVEYLRGIGCEVWTHDENGEQFRISPAGCEGHFGGSLDGVVILPPEWGIPFPLLGEFKTASKKNFERMVHPDRGGLIREKFQHYTQASCYGKEYSFSHVVYIVACKDDDRLHIEIVALNLDLGENSRVKALRVIQSQTAPPKLALDPTYWKCKFCAAKAVCHENEVPEHNCRSCRFAVPGSDKSWICTLPSDYGTLPDERIATGCDHWESITAQ